MSSEGSLLALASEVARIASGLNIDTAVIGGFALAAHNYVRATEDFDLGTDTSIFKLRDLDKALRAAGYVTELREPDEDDDLGGVIDVRRGVDDLGYVQVVSFSNLSRPGHRHPGKKAIATAEQVPNSPLRTVRLVELIIMMLHSWARLGDEKARRDALELLKRNPDVRAGDVENLARDFELEDAWQKLRSSD